MDEQHRELALAIKRCLENLAQDAAENEMLELAYIVSLAAAAAGEQAAGPEPIGRESPLCAGRTGTC